MVLNSVTCIWKALNTYFCKSPINITCIHYGMLSRENLEYIHSRENLENLYHENLESVGNQNTLNSFIISLLIGWPIWTFWFFLCNIYIFYSLMAFWSFHWIVLPFCSLNEKHLAMNSVCKILAMQPNPGCLRPLAGGWDHKTMWRRQRWISEFAEGNSCRGQQTSVQSQLAHPRGSHHLYHNCSAVLWHCEGSTDTMWTSEHGHVPIKFHSQTFKSECYIIFTVFRGRRPEARENLAYPKN